MRSRAVKPAPVGTIVGISITLGVILLLMILMGTGALDRKPAAAKPAAPAGATPAATPVAAATPAPAPAPVEEAKPADPNSMPGFDPEGRGNEEWIFLALVRLGLSADQTKKISALGSEYGTKRAGMDGKKTTLAEREAVTAERDRKIREALTAEQQPKFDAGLKIVADFVAKKQKLQQDNYAAMAAAGGEMEKRAAVRDDYKAKRGALDADIAKTLEAQVGKLPAGASK